MNTIGPMDEAEAHATCRQVMDNAARQRRLVLAEWTRRRTKARRLARASAVLAVAVVIPLAGIWLGWVRAESGDLAAALMANTAGIMIFAAIRRTNGDEVERLLHCAMKFGDLCERARNASALNWAEAKTARQIAAELEIEYAKLSSNAEALVPAIRDAQRRRYNRIRPQNAETTVTLQDGSAHPAILLDLSCTGAAMTTKVQAPVGAHIRVGRLESRIARTFKNGFAVEFQRPIPIDSLGPDFVL